MTALRLAVSITVLGAAGIAAAQDAPVLRGSIADNTGVRALLLRPKLRGTNAEPAPAPVAATAPAEQEPDATAASQPEADDNVRTEAVERTLPTAPQAATDDVATGTVRVETVDSAIDLQLDEGAVRAEAIEGLDRPDAEDNPYQAVGIPVGTFILKPTLEQGLTVTNNADSTVDGSGAVLSETALRLNAVSDWGSGLAAIDAYGVYRKSISGDDVDDYEGGALGRLEFDLGNEYRANAVAGIVVRPESAASPEAVEGAASQPLHTTLTGALGLEKALGKARFAVTGSVDRSMYGDADLENGDVLSQEDRNNTLYALELRTGYEISPALIPFVETEVGRRLYDEREDSAGYARSSNRFGFRGGLAFDRGEKLSGEIAAGWLWENYDDDRLSDISVPSVEAAVSWSPVRGTIVALTGSTLVEGATTADQSGSVLWSGRLSAEREMRSNLTGNASAGLGWRDYIGTNDHDLIFNAELGLTWWLNRYAGLMLRGRHETVSSNLPDRNARTDSVFLGLKVQR